MDNTEKNVAYGDDTIINFGKHKGKSLEEVPADWLNWWYTENSSIKETHPHYRLFEYIEDNIDVIKKEMKEQRSEKTNEIYGNTRHQFGK